MVTLPEVADVARGKLALGELIGCTGLCKCEHRLQEFGSACVLCNNGVVGFQAIRTRNFGAISLYKGDGKGVGDVVDKELRQVVTACSDGAIAAQYIATHKN